MTRVLLVAATTGYQVRSYGAAAKQMGVELVLATDRCHVLDDPWRDGAVAVRFDDPNGAVEAVRVATSERPLDAAIAVGDRPALLGATIARDLGLRGHPPAAVAAAGNKLLTRERFVTHGLPVPWFSPFPIDASAADVLASGAEFPCVVKPLAMAASRGVMRVDDPNELLGALARLRALLCRPEIQAQRDPSNETLLVEGFVPGPEVAVEGVVTGGELQTLAVFDKPDPLDGPFFEETIYVTPSGLGPGDHGGLHDAVLAAVGALGLTDGPIHAECRLSPRGVVVLEVAARPIGGLCARTLRFDTPQGQRVSLETLHLQHMLGAPVTGYRREMMAAGVMMIPIPSEGRFRQVAGVDEAQAVDHIEEVVITAKADQQIQPPPDGASYLGFIFARADGRDDVVTALRQAHGRLRFEIEPTLPVV